MNPLDAVVTAKEAAKLKGCTVQHISRLCRSGSLVARCEHGVWLILKSSIQSKEEVK